MTLDIKEINRIKGFIDDEEVEKLYAVSLEASTLGPIIEIGSYCGKSAYIIGSACKQNNSILFSVDHHRGSEEQQPGEAYFDSDLFDKRLSRINTLPFLQETLARNHLENTVIPIVSASRIAGKMWETSLSMVFIDGGHSYEAALNDYQTWSNHIKPGGYLVIHDIFFDPEKGGQAPRQVYELALESGDYIEENMTKTLGVLRKK